jgi:hypothetical protein
MREAATNQKELTPEEADRRLLRVEGKIHNSFQSRLNTWMPHITKEMTDALPMSRRIVNHYKIVNNGLPLDRWTFLMDLRFRYIRAGLKGLGGALFGYPRTTLPSCKFTDRELPPDFFNNVGRSREIGILLRGASPIHNKIDGLHSSLSNLPRKKTFKIYEPFTGLLTESRFGPEVNWRVVWAMSNTN